MKTSAYGRFKHCQAIHKLKPVDSHPFFPAKPKQMPSTGCLAVAPKPTLSLVEAVVGKVLLEWGPRKWNCQSYLKALFPPDVGDELGWGLFRMLAKMKECLEGTCISKGSITTHAPSIPHLLISKLRVGYINANALAMWFGLFEVPSNPGHFSRK